MFTKKTLIPIGALILVIGFGVFLFFESDVPNEPIKVYKTDTPDTPDQGSQVETLVKTVTAFPAVSEDVSAASGDSAGEVPQVILEDAQADTQEQRNAAARLDLARRMGMPTDPIPTIAELAAEVERREAEVERREAEDAKYERLQQELLPMLVAAEDMKEAMLADYADMTPLLSMTYDEFHQTYPTVAARREVAAQFMKIDAHRANFVALIENSSPQLREELYKVMREEDLFELYQFLLKPLPFVEWMDDLITEPNGGVQQ